MLKTLIVLMVLFCSVNLCHAEKTYDFLYFTASWCGYCPSVSDAIKTPEIQAMRKEYNRTYAIDIDKYPKWKAHYNVKSVPQVLVVEWEDGKDTVVGRWQLRSKETAQPDLLDFLKKFSPKKVLTRILK